MEYKIIQHSKQDVWIANYNNIIRDKTVNYAKCLKASINIDKTAVSRGNKRNV